MTYSLQTYFNFLSAYFDANKEALKFRDYFYNNMMDAMEDLYHNKDGKDLKDICGTNVLSHIRKALPEPMMDDLRKRKHYSYEFKLKTIRYVLVRGLSYRSAAYMMGCSPTIVSVWVKKFKEI